MQLLETSPIEKEALNRVICLLIIKKKGIFYGEGKDMHTDTGNKLIKKSYGIDKANHLSKFPLETHHSRHDGSP